MYLYLDAVFLLNLGIDYVLLWLTAVFRQQTYKKWRLFSASLLGSFYVLSLFWTIAQGYHTFLLKLFVSGIMVWWAFGFRNIQYFCGNFLMFYFVSFLSGGGILAAHYLLSADYQIENGIIYTKSTGFGDPLAWWFVLLGFLVMLWFSYSRWKCVQATSLNATHILPVVIYMQDLVIPCQGLLDTGNQLVEPFSRAPVMIIESQLLSSVLPTRLAEHLKSKEKWLDHFQMEEIETAWLRRLKLIPYRGVGQQMEWLLALKADRVEIVDGETIYVCSKVYIGCNQQVLSTDNRFQAILHPAMLDTKLKQNVELREGDNSHVS